MYSTIANTLRSSRLCGHTHCEINNLPSTIEQESDWNNSVIKTLKKHFSEFSMLPPPKILFPSLYPVVEHVPSEDDDDYYDNDEEEDVMDGNEFQHVSKEDVIEVIKMMYTKDMAYSAVLRSSSKASSLAAMFIEIFENTQENPNETIYYSNSLISNGRLYGMGGDLTKSTFGCGVLAVNKKCFGFIAIEDED